MLSGNRTQNLLTTIISGAAYCYSVFLVMVLAGVVIHISDILAGPASNTVVPGQLLEPCATMCWEDTTVPNREKYKGYKEHLGGKDDTDDYDENNDDYDDNTSDATDIPYCSSFIFSPDSRSLSRFCSDSRLFVWDAHNKIFAVVLDQ